MQAGGGMPDHIVPVQWQIATDENLEHTVQVGTELADPEFAHAVHIEVDGLEPNTEYYYQFRVGFQTSPIGRTKTAPTTGASFDSFKFAFASCQAWYHGYYTAYEYMAKDDLDLVIHLGDYIYEYAIDENGEERNTEVPEVFQSETNTLEEYRLRYALFKTDPHLQAAHSNAPWIVTWDDHEVDNNYADEISEGDDPASKFLTRRANAYQAFYEHLPIRPSRMPDGPDMTLYHQLSFGDLIDINLLDTRQYRSDQVCGDGWVEDCDERFDTSRTMLGTEQEQWLVDNMTSSDATWNVLAQQIFFSQRESNKMNSMDAWDGYVPARDQLIDVMSQDEVTNPIVITGDVHANYQADIKTDFDNPDAEIVGTEFIGTSITSGKDGSEMTDFGRRVINQNGHISYYNNQRGYVRCEVTQDQWQTDYRVVPYVTQPESSVRTDASFVVDAGAPGAIRK
ncbi:alkaline phosphatase D family protein [Haladaptatus pallidirubidus]|uniref:alkaline phosphatase D family protein n=1 Tax=Haladaptatus pallidirubidus TaxID=1008152 RepID=UPI0035EFA6BB